MRLFLHAKRPAQRAFALGSKTNRGDAEDAGKL